MKLSRRGWVRWVAVVGSAIAVAALGASAGGGAARGHAMTPASGPASLYQSIGQPLTASHGLVRFGCQLSTPPVCYGPDQIRAAYGIQPLLDQGFDGQGKTIVIIDAYGSSTINDDLAAFDSLWGLPAPPSFQSVTPFGVDTPPDPVTADGWAGETSLDVEWAHAVAPAAKIVLVVAKSSNDGDILDATQWVLENDAGDVLSQSYGEAEQCMDPTQLARQHDLFRSLTIRGITLFASSGDQGAGIPTCDGNAFFKAASTPATDPFVTSVGGTTLTADGTSGEYQSETTWNQTTDLGGPAAGGGGISVVYSRPSYQAPVSHVKMRTVPDVSYNAAVFGGVIVVWSSASQGGPYWLFGGTSAGSPQWAGIAAIADQMGHGRIGAINDSLYTVSKGHLGTLFFHDVADGSNNSLPDLTPYLGAPYGTPIEGFTAVPGYDLATGLGTPNASELVPWLAKRVDRSGNDYGSVAGSYNWSGHAGSKHEH